MKRVLIALLFLFAVVTSVSAQAPDKCKDDEKIATCLDRIAGAIDASAPKADPKKEEAKAQDEVAKTNTGVPSLTSPLGSALKDFLSLFSASADSSPLTRGSDGSLTLDLNLGAKKFVSGKPLKIQAVFHAPQLDPKVKAGLSGDTLSKAEKSIDELDDVSFSLSYSPQNRTIGRALDPHRPLFQALIGQVPVESPDALKLAGTIRSIEELAPGITKKTFGEMGEHRAAIEAQTILAAREHAKSNAEAVQRVKDQKVDEFITLLDQQPQFYASVIQRTRNELIGGDSLSFGVTYETSGHSLRNFYKFAAATCGETQLAARDSACATAWTSFVADEKTQAAMSTSGRFAFSVEYTGVDANKVEVALPAPATEPFKLETDDNESLIGSIKYGQVLSKAAEGPRESRFDVTVSYENVTGDKDKDNRFVASAVFSQKLTDTMTFPIGIVYANHEKDPKFNDTDRKLSVHFGLVFKLPSLDALKPKS